MQVCQHDDGPVNAAGDPAGSAAGPERSQYNLNTKQAAAYLGVSPAALTYWRQRARRDQGFDAPPHTTLGRLIRFSKADLDTWQLSRLANRKV